MPAEMTAVRRPPPAGRADIVPLTMLLLVAATAWLVLARLPAMPDMTMSAASFLAMWAAMVGAMMLPTVAPMLIACAAVLRGRRGAPLLLAAFVAPYAVLWLLAGFSALGISRVAMDRPAVAAGLVAAAGAYQLGALKHRCLRACRSPIAFFVHYGGGLATVSGCARTGLRHAAACFGCCVGLMVALTGAGAIGLGWMVALTAVMLAEKMHARGRELGLAVGVLLLAVAPIVWVK